MIEAKLLLLILGMVRRPYNYGNAELCDADIIPVGLNYLVNGTTGKPDVSICSIKRYCKKSWFGFYYSKSVMRIKSSCNTLRIELFEPFNIQNKYYGFIETKEYIQRGNHFHFDEDLYNNCPDNSSLYGFFQSPKYF